MCDDVAECDGQKLREAAKSNSYLQKLSHGFVLTLGFREIESHPLKRIGIS